MAVMTRMMAQAVNDGGPYGVNTVERWNEHYGEPTVAALAEAGLIERDPVWSGTLVLTDLGERVGNRLRQMGGGFAVRAAERIDDERWQWVRAMIAQDFPTLTLATPSHVSPPVDWFRQSQNP